MSFAYGIVNSDGNPERAGSNDWSSSKTQEGRYVVTFQLNLFSSPPVPVVSAVGNDLTTPSSGGRHFLTITQLSEASGVWSLGVGVNNIGNQPKDVGFSFMILN